MSVLTREDVRTFLSDQLARQLGTQGRDVSANGLQDDCDLLLSGKIDSLGLLELTAALDDYCGFEIDFETLDPEHMTIVGPLCDFVVAQAGSRR
jgi:acyl carrier protein